MYNLSCNNLAQGFRPLVSMLAHGSSQLSSSPANPKLFPGAVPPSQKKWGWVLRSRLVSLTGLIIQAPVHVSRSPFLLFFLTGGRAARAMILMLVGLVGPALGGVRSFVSLVCFVCCFSLVRAQSPGPTPVRDPTFCSFSPLVWEHGSHWPITCSRIGGGGGRGRALRRVMLLALYLLPFITVRTLHGSWPLLINSTQTAHAMQFLPVGPVMVT